MTNKIANLNVLEACSITHGESKKRSLYLTPVLPYALFYFRDREVNYVTFAVKEDNIVHYYENFPDQLRVIYQNQSGYLYNFHNNSNLQETNMKGVWISNDNIPVQNVEFVDYVNERRLEFVNDKSIIVHYFEERNPEEIEQYNEHRVFLQKCESNEFIENQLL